MTLMAFPIDADVANADWAKHTWDLDTEDTLVWLAALSFAEVKHFATLPCYQAAPPEVVAAVQARLASA